MGHQHLGVLPRSKDWQQVIALLSEGANLEDIAAAASRAAETSMIDASGDPAVRHAFWLLTQIPLAARRDDFERALRTLGLRVPAQPSLAEITSAMMDAIDRAATGSHARNDFSEMAQLCAAESLSAIVGSEIRDLFATTKEKVKPFGPCGKRATF
jgi:Flp pilus assembly protein TadD